MDGKRSAPCEDSEVRTLAQLVHSTIVSKLLNATRLSLLRPVKRISIASSHPRLARLRHITHLLDAIIHPIERTKRRRLKHLKIQIPNLGR